jgi:hypothetical protein
LPPPGVVAWSVIYRETAGCLFLQTTLLNDYPDDKVTLPDTYSLYLIVLSRPVKLSEGQSPLQQPCAGKKSGYSRELKEKVGLMLNEYEKIIAQELPGVIKTFLGNREIGEILQQALENVTHRMGQLAVLDRWKGKATEPDPQATDNSKTETRQVPVPEGNDLVAPPAE